MDQTAKRQERGSGGAGADPLDLPCGGPAKTVDLGESGKAEVFHFGIIQIQRYAREIGQAMLTLGQVPVDTKGPIRTQYMAAMLPYVMLNLLGLVAECVAVRDAAGKRVSINGLPHWLLPPIIEAWVEVNLGEENRWGPWLAVVERTVTAMTGKDIRISAMFSKPSSPPATPPESSSTADAPGGPTEGGASGS